MSCCAFYNTLCFFMLCYEGDQSYVNYWGNHAVHHNGMPPLPEGDQDECVDSVSRTS